jgi:4-diphosphocytidyl-2C-methyl-D-erythritol kinase
MHELCAQLGSDLNVCLEGGRILAKGRGEIIEKQEFVPFNLSLIKPKNLGISAKEAYTKFSFKKENNIDLNIRNNFDNDLEWAIINDYKELQHIKQKYPESKMTGSGSTYYFIDGKFEQESGYEVFNDLTSINKGVCTVK